MSRNKRILKEIKKGQTSEILEFLDDEAGEFGDKGNCYLRFWTNNGPYAGQVHVLQVRFIYGSNTIYKFPLKPPNVTFITSMYHANVYVKGSICLDILREDKWSAMNDINTLMNSIWALLGDPNHNSPAHGAASRAAKKSTPEEFQQMSMDYYVKGFKGNERAIRLLTTDRFQSGMDPEKLTEGYLLRKTALAANNVEI